MIPLVSLVSVTSVFRLMLCACEDIVSFNSPKVFIEKQIDSQLSLSRCFSLFSAILFAGIAFRDAFLMS